MTGRRARIAVSVLVLALAGCGGPGNEESAPSPTASSRSGAPVPAQARSAESTYASPCTTLFSTAELAALDVVGEGRGRTYSTISECAWTTTADDRLRVGVDVTRDLLVDSYGGPRPAVFVPVEIENAPAVRQRLSGTTNTCNVTVSLAAAQSLEVDWTGAGPPSQTEDPCAKAEEAIALVVRKLPPQG